jgi:hypothetical protein
MLRRVVHPSKSHRKVPSMFTQGDSSFDASKEEKEVSDSSNVTIDPSSYALMVVRKRARTKSMLRELGLLAVKPTPNKKASKKMIGPHEKTNTTTVQRSLLSRICAKKIAHLVPLPAMFMSTAQCIDNFQPIQSIDIDDGNDSFCFICNTGGELICCDNCSKAGHEECPVLTINSLPDVWHCPLCCDEGRVPCASPLMPNIDIDCHKPPRYVPYKCTYVPYDGTFGMSDQGQTLDV